MTDQLVLLERRGAVAIITLHRPEVGNAINMPLALALERVVETVIADLSMRCVMLMGAGKLFCAGGDIAAFVASGADASSFMLDLAGRFHRSVLKLARMPKPLVVLVNGPAAGAGFSLAITGDIVLAARSAHFLAAYSTVGLTPDGGMSWLLPKLVGLRAAQEIILGNRRIDSEEASAMGLVTRAVDDDQLLSQGMNVAQGLSTGASQALGGARKLLARGFENSLADHLEAEALRISEAIAGIEAREGIAAYIERRKPNFSDVHLTSSRAT